MAYITTTEIAEIRKALKAKYGKQFKFSVRKQSGGRAVDVSIVRGDTDFSSLWKGKAVDDYGYGYVQINSYHTTAKVYGSHAKLFSDIVDIIKTAPANAKGGKAWYNKSDIMTDYFDTAFYFDLEVGKWDQPYVQIEK